MLDIKSRKSHNGKYSAQSKAFMCSKRTRGPPRKECSHTSNFTTKAGPTDPTARPHDDILSQHPDAAQTLVLSAVLNSGARNFSKFIYTFPQANGEKTSKLGRFGHEVSEIACYDFSNP